MKRRDPPWQCEIRGLVPGEERLRVRGRVLAVNISAKAVEVELKAGACGPVSLGAACRMGRT